METKGTKGVTFLHDPLGPLGLAFRRTPTQGDQGGARFCMTPLTPLVRLLDFPKFRLHLETISPYTDLK